MDWFGLDCKRKQFGVVLEWIHSFGTKRFEPSGFDREEQRQGHYIVSLPVFFPSLLVGV